MAITRSKKEEIVFKFSKLIKKADLLVFLGFRKLSVAKASELRRKLRAIGASYMVAKKRLARIVLKNEGIEMPSLEGEVAFIVSGDDSLAAAKEVYVFARAHKETVHMLGGVFKKSVIDGATVVRLALIPSREVLVAHMLGVLQGPMRGLVGVLNGNQRKLVTVLKQIAEKR
ncbi:MAG: large subunit ribosomal protein L10 [Parcubacteria group bacterium Gr01-1014_70]|nr:MAG: large subunit ribosomal protein L10 [Parcubacteria group bacterium Gr01-1014_70]